MTKIPFVDGLRTRATDLPSSSFFDDSVVLRPGERQCINVIAMLKADVRFLHIENHHPNFRQAQSVLIDLQHIRGLECAPFTLFCSKDGEIQAYPVKLMANKPVKNVKQMLGFESRTTRVKFEFEGRRCGINRDVPPGLIESYASTNEASHRLYYRLDAGSSRESIQQDVRALFNGLLGMVRSGGTDQSLDRHLRGALLALGCTFKGIYNEPGSVLPLLLDVICSEGMELAVRGNELKSQLNCLSQSGEAGCDHNARMEYRAMGLVLNVLIDTLREERLIPVKFWGNKLGNYTFEQAVDELESALLTVRLGDSPMCISDAGYPAEITLAQGSDDVSVLGEGSVAPYSESEESESYASDDSNSSGIRPITGPTIQ